MRGFAFEGIIAILLGIVLLAALAPFINEQLLILSSEVDPFSRALLSIIMPLCVFILVLLLLAYF